MNLTQFLARLRKTPRKWAFVDKWIRCNGRCPIAFLAGTFTYQWERGARNLGLEHRLAHRLAAAADGETDGPIRKKLLKACGLKARA